MKKLISVTLLTAVMIVAAVSVSGCGLLNRSEYRNGPAMWVVEDDNGNVCYLMGSIHVGKDDGMFPFADIIEDAFASCDQLALEYDMIAAEKEKENMTEMELGMYYAKQFMYQDGSSVTDHLSEEAYNGAVAFLKEKEMYQLGLERLNAAYWYMLIENVVTEEQGAVSDNGVDIYFANKAYETNKTVVSIESEQSQLDMLNSVADTVYDTMILSILNSNGSFVGAGLTTEVMLSTYKKGRMDVMQKLVEMSRETPVSDEEYTAAFADYDNKMYTDRNRLMADAVKRFLAEGKKTFVVVGCAHMLCDDGIVSLLTKEGYKVYRK